MKYLTEFIYKDKILLVLLAGILTPIVFLLIGVLMFYLQMEAMSKSISSLFTPLFYVFTFSLLALVIYVPFIKKTSKARTKETKIIIAIWLLISVILLVFLNEKIPLSLSDLKIETIAGISIYVGGVLFLVGIPFFILNLILSRAVESKKMIIIWSVVVVIIASSLSALIGYNIKPTKIVVPYPIAIKHYGDSYACEGLTTSTSFANKENLGNGNGVIVDSGTKNVDRLAIKIDGENLQFVTGASVQIGETNSPPLNILQNDDKRLIAVDLAKPDSNRAINVFILNKENGLAAWQETETNYVLTGNPSGYTEYFVCR